MNQRNKMERNKKRVIGVPRRDASQQAGNRANGGLSGFQDMSKIFDFSGYIEGGKHEL